MAIDTRDKRASAFRTCGVFIPHLPAPNGAVTAPDRKFVGWTYSGIAAGAPVAADDLIALCRSTSPFVFARIFGRVN